jgi:signal transduction histidine kinase
VVVATGPHLRGLNALLTSGGLDVEALTASGRYQTLDAASLLTSFMRDGMPDAGLFDTVIGDLVAGAIAGGGPVRIFGEMVAILWARGQQEAALRLEELWNGLQAHYRFTLCCGYPVHSFADRGMEASFDRVCDHHSRVLPAESYSRAASEDERLRAVARLQQRTAALEREAHEALRMRNEFLVAASHDLRTPISVILGYAQMLRRRLSGDDTRTNEGLQSIERRARLMASVVDEMADATRLESGGAIALQREMIDLAALAEETAREQQHTARHRLTMQIENRPLIGFWDPVRLRRVVANLIGNAVKYSPDGGEITIRLRREGNAAVLSVRDAGMGIPRDDLPHIFSRFVRGTNALEITAGTGIGLATARQIVERHGGSISVESVEGSGSVFTIRLPLTDRSEWGE